MAPAPPRSSRCCSRSGDARETAEVVPDAGVRGLQGQRSGQGGPCCQLQANGRRRGSRSLRGHGLPGRGSPVQRLDSQNKSRGGRRRRGSHRGFCGIDARSSWGWPSSHRRGLEGISDRLREAAVASWPAPTGGGVTVAWAVPSSLDGRQQQPGQGSRAWGRGRGSWSRSSLASGRSGRGTGKHAGQTGRDGAQGGHERGVGATFDRGEPSRPPLAAGQRARYALQRCEQ